MEVRSIGVVKRNFNDGKRLKVTWDKNFELKEIKTFTYMKNVTKIDKSKWNDPINWIFYDIEQDYFFDKDIKFDSNESKSIEINYWVFQGNPKIYNFKQAIKDNILNEWSVSSHKNKIKSGDKFIIWLTGKDSGCYGFGDIISDPYISNESEDDHIWNIKESKKSSLKVGINLTINLMNNPISKTEINNYKELNDLNVGVQGTNFTATKEQYNKLMEISKNMKNLTLNQILYGPPGTGKTYNTINKALKILNPKFFS